MDENKSAIWAVVALTATALAAVTTLAVLGKPLDVVMTLVTALVVPTIASMFTLLQVGKLQKDVSVVREQTNGNMSKLLEKIPQAPSADTTPTDTAPPGV